MQDHRAHFKATSQEIIAACAKLLHLTHTRPEGTGQVSLTGDIESGTACARFFKAVYGTITCGQRHEGFDDVASVAFQIELNAYFHHAHELVARATALRSTTLALDEHIALRAQVG